MNKIDVSLSLLLLETQPHGAGSTSKWAIGVTALRDARQLTYLELALFLVLAF